MYCQKCGEDMQVIKKVFQGNFLVRVYFCKKDLCTMTTLEKVSCPDCGLSNSTITRTSKGENCTIRHRLCNACSKKFKTIEYEKGAKNEKSSH